MPNRGRPWEQIELCEMCSHRPVVDLRAMFSQEASLVMFASAAAAAAAALPCHYPGFTPVSLSKISSII